MGSVNEGPFIDFGAGTPAILHGKERVLTHPTFWRVPRSWPGERAFVICCGASVNQQRELIAKIPKNVIAVKQSIVLRPQAESWFLGGEKQEFTYEQCRPFFRGGVIVSRWKSYALPAEVNHVNRAQDHTRWSDDPSRVAGYDSGTSAINLAILRGASEVIVLGMDMCGGHWFHDELPHPKPFSSEKLFNDQKAPFASLAEDAKRKGVRIVNVSPNSTVDAYERGRLKEFV